MLKTTGFALYLFTGIKIKIYDVQWPRCKSYCPRHSNLLISLYPYARCNSCARRETVGFFSERVQILKEPQGLSAPNTEVNVVSTVVTYQNMQNTIFIFIFK